MDHSDSTFLYFAYGSNLNSQRIHMNNPTAVWQSVGRIDGYRLDFGYWSNTWQGSVATIVPDEVSTVFGCIWKINLSDLPNLDNAFWSPIYSETKNYADMIENKFVSYLNPLTTIDGLQEYELSVSYISSLMFRQEGVDSNIYRPIEVVVKDVCENAVSCRCYELINQPSKIPSGEEWPENRKPSALYHRIIVQGAIESRLPDYYIAFLKCIQHNNNEVELHKLMLAK